MLGFWSGLGSTSVDEYIRFHLTRLNIVEHLLERARFVAFRTTKQCLVVHSLSFR